MIMPRLSAVSAGTLLALSLALSGAFAEPEGSAAPSAHVKGPAIAVLDVGQVLNDYVRFQTMRAEVQAEIARAEARVKEQNEAIRKLADELNGVAKDPESPEAKAMQEDVAKRRADLQAMIQLQRKEFLSREAKIYHTAYQDLLHVVEAYAKENDIRVVLRSHGASADPNKPEAVLRDINRPLVWFDDRLDITSTIVARLNERARKPKSTVTAPPEPEKATQAPARPPENDPRPS